MADRLTELFGSWRFLGYMTAFILIWITFNVVAIQLRWDPYPFILLNLVFSTQASYAAPLILLAQNRTADRDRMQAEHDFACNQRAEAKIDLMLKRLGISQTDINAINLEIDALQPPEFQNPAAGNSLKFTHPPEPGPVGHNPPAHLNSPERRSADV